MVVGLIPEPIAGTTSGTISGIECPLVKQSVLRQQTLDDPKMTDWDPIGSPVLYFLTMENTSLLFSRSTQAE